MDKLVEANKSLYQAASKLHKKAADRIDTLEKGLVEIKEVAHISEGALGYDAEKRKKAETNLEDLMALTYGEHVWTDDDKG